MQLERVLLVLNLIVENYLPDGNNALGIPITLFLLLNYVLSKFSALKNAEHSAALCFHCMFMSSVSKSQQKLSKVYLPLFSAYVLERPLLAPYDVSLPNMLTFAAQQGR